MDATIRRALSQSHSGLTLDDPLGLAAVDDPAKPGTPRYVIRLLSPIANRNYRVLQFGASSGPGGGAFTGVTFRYDEDSNSDQTYIFEHRAPASAVRVFAGTRHARLVLDSNLAAVDMRFSPTSATRQRTFGCDAFLAPEASRVTWTLGRLVGSFGFTPHEASLESHATDVRALVERIVPTGKHCPVSPGFCPRQWNFWFGDANTNVTAFELPPGSGPEFFAIDVVGGRTNVELRFLMLFPLETHPLTRPPGEVHVRFGNSGPFFGGHAAFERTVAAPRQRVCRANASIHRFRWSSGAVQLRYDDKPVTLTGADLEAGSILIYHHHR
jgi:hypothetical protein